CLKRASTNRVGLKRARALHAAAEQSIGITTGLTGARQRLQACPEELRFYSGQLQALEAQLAETLAMTGLAEVLLSVPGIGVIAAAGFLAEIGDVARQLQKVAGLNLTEQSSGEKRGQRTISKKYPYLPDERPRVPRLPLLAELSVPGPDLVRLVTFLNQALKGHGFIFDLSRDGESYRMSVYQVPDGPAPLELANENREPDGR
ncbi:MAG: DUF4264 family protein, partial [Bacillota bacterium]